MLKAIVFDLDNTLMDFMKMKKRGIEASIYAMIDAGLQISFNEAQEKIDKIYAAQGMEYQQVFDQFLQNELSKIDHKILAAGIVAYRKAREAELNPYPHAFPTLITLQKMGLKLGIVSDAPSKEAWLRLAYLNFHHIFDAIVTFDDTYERKPSSVPFKTILSRLQVSPNEALMVGDWYERDIIGANQLGMLTAFAKYGDTFDTKNHTADYELNDIKELIDIVKRLNNL